MPVSVEVHHSLTDGVHVDRFLERLQHHLSTPATALGNRSPRGGEDPARTPAEA